MTKLPGFDDAVAQSWNSPVDGSPMVVVWKKLKRLRKVLGTLSKQFAHTKLQLAKAREDLAEAQDSLVNDRMNREKIDKVKMCTETMIRWNEIDEEILQQRSKLDWLKLGDENNAYFHASIRAKHKAKSIDKLELDDGSVVQDQDEIEAEVLRFYKSLMGDKTKTIQAIDIVAMRAGTQVKPEQADMLTSQVIDQEIVKSLNSIGDLKSLGIDDYGAMFFKASWNTIRTDVIAAVKEFFEHGKMYMAVNCTLVTLVPKHDKTKTIREYRPIAGCTTLYKIISKILTMS